MPIRILMPALSPTMTEGTIAKWVKKEGDAVESGDVLAEIETDKATMEVESIDDGTMGKILVAEGTEGVAVNQVIALLLEDGEDASALDGVDVSAPAPTSPPAAVPASAPVPVAPAPSPVAPAPSPVAPAPSPVAPAPSPVAPAPSSTPSSGRTIASPLAKRLATERGIDLASVTGTGPKGRIVKRDIETAVPGAVPVAAAASAPITAPPPTVQPTAQPTPGLNAADPLLGTMPEFEAVPNSTMRKVIAKRLTESARDIPHFNLTMEIEIDRLLDYRKRLNGKEGADYKISVNDFVVKAVALALARVPEANASYTDEATLLYQRADISIAVAIDGGLITPVIRDAGNKGLAQISAEAKALALRARAGQLQPPEYEGGTFTISNLGMFGIKSFTSIINPPQGAILSVGAGEPRPIVKSGALSTATVMTLTLAVDHRCIDGATGAKFISELKAILEEPLQFML